MWLLLWKSSINFLVLTEIRTTLKPSLIEINPLGGSIYHFVINLEAKKDITKYANERWNNFYVKTNT